ncbi:DUF2987 domain-containing protein [Shewanella sp. NIFS-20-20]|uniref:DUF2987 domain-containing protein n=1 Tax=Shewanella sp. NIFS-20-20 TaxID=2853806 RepID=UPI001C443DE6|nr:DUF2987 domain-containing protein [Shewanella sp. NIFS-20-20]MBV7315701.1 DUF2987 domain-containing protein [Shewanella sp. NIFS-20-20]
MNYVKGLARVVGWLTVVSCTAGATEVSLSYEDFFSRIKQADKAELQLVELTFSVPKNAQCVLDKASIVTEKETFPVTFTKEQRLFLPYDQRLKQDRAMVKLDIEGDASQCGIAVQIRAKALSTNYDSQRLKQLYHEMDSLQAMLKGFPMRLFHEPLKGLQFTFTNSSEAILNGRSLGEAKQWTFSAAQIAEATTLGFSHAPQIISPWVK